MAVCPSSHFLKKMLLAALPLALCCCGTHGSESSEDEAGPSAVEDTVPCSLPAKEEVNLSPEEDASDFVLLSDVVPDVIQEIRYYTTYNFVGTRIDGYEQPVALMTREAAEGLLKVSDWLAPKGYRLKIFDAYRPQMAVDHFIRWFEDETDTLTKQYFYPEIPKSQIFPRGFVSRHSGHSRGSTVDLTLFDMKSEREADMGGTFDFFGDRSHFDYPGITVEQRRLRNLLREAMSQGGFRPIDGEWWHFTLRNEPFPDTFFTFPNSVSSLPNRE